MRKKKLPNTHNAGILEVIDFFTVNQRPPKNITPNTIPATKANIIDTISFIIFFFIVVHFFIFFSQPIPGDNAACK